MDAMLESTFGIDDCWVQSSQSGLCNLFIVENPAPGGVGWDRISGAYWYQI